MKNHIVYKDGLIQINEKAIIFYRYSLLFMSKAVPFQEIEHIKVRKPTLLNGKFIFWGTETGLTWYPLDLSRPKRKVIFIIKRRCRMLRIGFTVQNESEVFTILHRLGYIEKTEVDNVHNLIAFPE